MQPFEPDASNATISRRRSVRVVVSIQMAFAFLYLFLATMSFRATLLGEFLSLATVAANLWTASTFWPRRGRRASRSPCSRWAPRRSALRRPAGASR